MTERFPPGGYPSGWYVVRPSVQLRRGQVETVHYFGRDMVLYRTEGGEARLVPSVCPHLGAHLGLGEVVGDRLRCPMHGFEFDGTGQCVALAYGTRPPPKARLGAYTLRELDGFVFLWYAPDGGEPTFELEPLDWEGWTSLRHGRMAFAGHPQETTENSVDMGHFASVHHYRATVEQEPVAEGAKLTAGYRVFRPLFGKRDRLFTIQAKFHILAHGLGYSLVHADIVGTPASIRYFINATPVDEGSVHLNIAAATREVLPGLDWVIREGAFQGLRNDVSQDIPFWERKQYLERPLLAEGDGPIPIYRRWCEQFYAGALGRDRLAAVSDGLGSTPQDGGTR